MIMNVAAASLRGIRTVMRMQSRDEPQIAHFVGGEGKPWLFMVRSRMECQVAEL